jgi:UDP-N-acetylglucosamine 4,6-dehydratase
VSLFEDHDPARVAIYSRNERRPNVMKQTYGEDSRIRFFIGEIRDRDRLEMAMPSHPEKPA